LSLLANSDVYVRGVKRESFGISKIEALWVKIPVISTKTGETRGMQLYDFDDEAQLVKQIRVALSNGPSDEANQWREFFTASAQDNLAEILKVIGR
jgi:glycosyltransferase involved in cell wall biosynthesis